MGRQLKMLWGSYYPCCVFLFFRSKSINKNSIYFQVYSVLSGATQTTFHPSLKRVKGTSHPLQKNPLCLEPTLARALNHSSCDGCGDSGIIASFHSYSFTTFSSSTHPFMLGFLIFPPSLLLFSNHTHSLNCHEEGDYQFWITNADFSSQRIS